MSEVSEPVAARRAALASQIEELAVSQATRIASFAAVESFLNSATSEAAFGAGIALFGRMRTAGQAIPAEFETLYSGGGLVGADRRVVPFVRSNQFVALVATLEDFLSSVLGFVLRAHPDQLEPRLTELRTTMTPEEAIESAAAHRTRKLFYKSPLKYGQAIAQHLLMSPPSPSFLAVWPEFVEMKARRDIGVHANWRRNAIYATKVSDVNGPVDSNGFLGVTAGYFVDAQSTGRRLVESVAQHCAVAFACT